jgi:short-subunit dehydrogenase
MMRAFAPVLEKNAPANIINIASIAARSPLPFIAGYAASKAALRSATLTARTELTKKGVVVQIVNPGPIDTDINKGAPWDMPSPDDTARIILDEVETGKREIFPDKIGQEMYALWQEDPDKFYKQNLGE